MNDAEQNDQQPAAAETPEQGAPPAASTDGSQNTVTRQPEAIPYARFQQVVAERNQVVAERNQLQERIKALEPKAEPVTNPAVTPPAPSAEALAAQAEVERLTAELDGMRTAQQGQLTKRLERVPKHIRDLLESMDVVKALAWLENNEDQLLPRTAPETDAGKTGEGKGKRQVAPKRLSW
jgi:hypothetical protein